MKQNHLSPIRLIFFIAVTALTATSCEQPAEPGSQKIAAAIAQTAQMPDLTALRQQFAAGQMSSEQIVTIYLQRIELIDRKGPTLRSVIAVNPNAVNQAKASDERRRASAELGPLDGTGAAPFKIGRAHV